MPRDFSPRGAPTTYFSDPDVLAIDPAFDGIIPDVAPVEPAPSEVVGVSRVSATAVPPPLPAAQPRALPSDLQIQDSVGFRGAIPGIASGLGSIAAAFGRISASASGLIAKAITSRSRDRYPHACVTTAAAISAQEGHRTKS